MNTAEIPSLLGSPVAQSLPGITPSKRAKTPLDLLCDGFMMLFLLKQGQEPADAQAFSDRILQLLSEYEQDAKRLDIAGEDIHTTKYAFCAAVDEAVLNSSFAIREYWMLRPLQLSLFGDQLAGENFFTRLEELRARGAPRLPSLEVFHMCLLLGFQGKYMIEGKEKLAYLTARLGDEISALKGKPAGFAPRWARPDKVSHALKSEAPLWRIGLIFATLAALAYIATSHMLTREVLATLAPYHHVVELGPRAAHLTISLP
jgi:type VI secretion system protein ImpK